MLSRNNTGSPSNHIENLAIFGRPSRLRRPPVPHTRRCTQGFSASREGQDEIIPALISGSHLRRVESSAERSQRTPRAGGHHQRLAYSPNSRIKLVGSRTCGRSRLFATLMIAMWSELCTQCSAPNVGNRCRAVTGQIFPVDRNGSQRDFRVAPQRPFGVARGCLQASPRGVITR